MHVGETSAIFIGNVTRKRGNVRAIRTVDLRFTRSRTSFPRRSFERRLLRPGSETSNAGGLRDFAQMHQRPRVRVFLFFSSFFSPDR